MTGLRVATLNIAHGRGRDRVVDLGRTAELLRSLAADVLCLQEVDRHFSPRSGWVDQCTVLAQALGMTAVYGASVRRPPVQPHRPHREYGNAVLSRLPTRDSRLVPLPRLPRTEPRAILVVQLAGGLHVACTHLQHDSAAGRAAQVAAALAELPLGSPVVLAGDFNATPAAPELSGLRDRLVDCWEVAGRGSGVTFPRLWSGRRLDYVLVTPGLRPVSAAVVPTTASDHHALVVDVQTGEPAVRGL